MLILVERVKMVLGEARVKWIDWEFVGRDVIGGVCIIGICYALKKYSESKNGKYLVVSNYFDTFNPH